MFGCLFFLPLPSWQQMVSYVTSVILISFGLGPIILIILRKKLPERERPFKLKWAGIIAPLAFFRLDDLLQPYLLEIFQHPL